MHLPGITVVGPLAPAIQISTAFSAAIASTSQQPESVRTLLQFFASH